MNWSYSLDNLARKINAHLPGDSTRFGAVSTDTRTLREGDVYFALSGENFDGHDFVEEATEKGASAVVVVEEHPGSLSLVVPDPLEALQQFAGFHRRQYDIPLIAITGSCGKTMAKDLTAALLATKYNVVKTQGNLNNEIGCPLSLFQLNSGTEMAVFELGANHAGEIANLCRLARPSESAITMIAPSHLEGFGSVASVAKAKAEIVEALPEDGTFYVNVDDSRCVAIAEQFEGQKIAYGGRGDVVLESCDFDEHGEMRLRIHPIGELRLPLAARAHAMNVVLAVAIALRHGVAEFEGPLREACASLTRFRISTIGPIEVIDDTYNANPASVEAALEALMERPGGGVRMAALGEMLELGDESRALHEQMGQGAGRAGVSRLFCKGPSAAIVAKAAEAAGVSRAEVFEDPEDIAHEVYDCAQSGDVLLVKGSRGMRMERVIDSLRSLYSGAEEPCHRGEAG